MSEQAWVNVLNLPEEGQQVEFETKSAVHCGTFRRAGFFGIGFYSEHGVCWTPVQVTSWRPAPTFLDRLVDLLKVEGWENTGRQEEYRDAITIYHRDRKTLDYWRAPKP
jgi:hypothetical protein